MQQFTDAEFMSAQQKEKVLKHWVRFLSNNLQERFFTSDLYVHLHLHCDVIAYYDQARFFDKHFSTGDGKIGFLEHFDADKPSSEWLTDRRRARAYDDINSAMIEEARKFLPVLYSSAIAEQRDADLELVERLLNRHGLTISAAVPLGRVERSNVIAAAPVVQGDLFIDGTKAIGARV